MAVSSQTGVVPRNWPSARYFTEAIQCPSICFAHPQLRNTLPAVDRLGMPLVTSGQFAYVYKLNSMNGDDNFAVRCFRGYLGDRDQRYRAIQTHLGNSPVSYLSDFTYAPEGILVSGLRFPILFMKWIEGPTLDVYISEMLHRPDVLLHLSEEWLRLLDALRTSGIAHGDLQHGNIIVEHGQLRLVDHDGIFVPAMAGWTASEVGHQHYQHPRRTAAHFDSDLDNFSSLVIYLSLLSLAERPQLWQEHHDENLLFTKSDFADPAASELFSKIREIGPDHARFADVLANGATGSPDQVPSLLDLVQAKSKLPSWMTAPADIDATTKTREVAIAERPAERQPVRWVSWQEKSRGASMPTTPGSPFVQSLFNTPAAAPLIKDPHDVMGNAVVYSKEFMRKYFLLWYWASYTVMRGFGFDFAISLFGALICMVIGCFTYGVVKAREESRKAKGLATAGVAWQAPGISTSSHFGGSSASGPASISAHSAPAPIAKSWLPPPAVTAPPPSQNIPWTPPVNQSTPTAITPAVSDPYVGNIVLGIYHVENCDWVDHISTKNRVGFLSASEAASHGFKPCRICSPAA